MYPNFPSCTLSLPSLLINGDCWLFFFIPSPFPSSLQKMLVYINVKYQACFFCKFVLLLALLGY